MENIGARINPHWKEAEPYFVEQDDARREADVDQQVEVGQHELPADHLRRAPQLAARGWRPLVGRRVAARWRLRGGGRGGVDRKESQIGDGLGDGSATRAAADVGRKGEALVRWVSRSAGPLDGDPMDMAGLIALSQGSVCCVPVSVEQQEYDGLTIVKDYHA